MADQWATWDEIRATLNVDEAAVAEHKARMRAEMRATRLADLRRAAAMTQSELADQIGVGQRRVSRIEHGDFEHVQLSTVRSYIEALGGTVEVVASFGDERVVISS